MSESESPGVTPKSSETDPPAANQPLEDAPDGASAQPTGEPAPTPVPVAAPAGGQIAPGKPDGEVDA